MIRFMYCAEFSLRAREKDERNRREIQIKLNGWNFSSYVNRDENLFKIEKENLGENRLLFSFQNQSKSASTRNIFSDLNNTLCTYVLSDYRTRMSRIM